MSHGALIWPQTASSLRLATGSLHVHQRVPWPWLGSCGEAGPSAGEGRPSLGMTPEPLQALRSFGELGTQSSQAVVSDTMDRPAFTAEVCSFSDEALEA